MVRKDNQELYFLHREWEIQPDANRDELQFDNYKAPINPEHADEFDLQELKAFNFNCATGFIKYSDPPGSFKIARKFPINWENVYFLPIRRGEGLIPDCLLFQETNDMPADEVKNIQLTREYNANLTNQIKISLIWVCQKAIQRIFGVAPTLDELAYLNSKLVRSLSLHDGNVVHSYEIRESLFGPISNTNDFFEYDKTRVMDEEHCSYAIILKELDHINVVRLSDKMINIFRQVLKRHRKDVDNMLIRFRENHELAEFGKLGVSYLRINEFAHDLKEYADW